MRVCGVCALLVVVQPVSADPFGTGVHEFEIEFRAIGEGGNAADDTGFGAVAGDYRMGTHEVSRAMIESFNALADEEPITMADLAAYGGNGGARPATGVRWDDAARFVNWLNTSKGYPRAYGVSASLHAWPENTWGRRADNPIRHRHAVYFLPSEDEWYKAAYYGGSGGSYFDYSTGSDTPPLMVSSGTVEGTAVYGLGTPAGPADPMDAGGLSPFGTMGQGGNAREWTETLGGRTYPVSLSGMILDGGRIVRGGSFGSEIDALQATHSESVHFNLELADLGFRVASLPERTTPGPIRITGMSHQEDGSLRVVWTGARDPAYLQYSPQLDPAEWSCVAVPADGVSGDMIVFHPPENGGFYRIFMPPEGQVDLRAQLHLELLCAQLENYKTDKGLYPEARDSNGLIIYYSLFGDGVGADGIWGTSDDTTPDGRTDSGAKVYLPGLDPDHNALFLLEGQIGQAPVRLLDAYGRSWKYVGGTRYTRVMHNEHFDLSSVGPDGQWNTDDDLQNW